MKYRNKILHPLTLKDVIETLITYDIEHCRFPINYMHEYFGERKGFMGLAMDDKKLILINKELGMEEMRETLIHEFLHTHHYRKGDLTGRLIETIVEKEINLTYKKLYKVKI